MEQTKKINKKNKNFLKKLLTINSIYVIIKPRKEKETAIK